MKLNKLSLNTIRLNRIGLNRIGSTSVGSSATDRPYISPDVLSALAGVWIADGKSNTDSDRNIIKNKLPGRGGDFEIFNAAYEGMSSYNGYPAVFGENKTYQNIPNNSEIWNLDITPTVINITKFTINSNFSSSYIKRNGELVENWNKDYPSYRVRITGITPNLTLGYQYLNASYATTPSAFYINSNGTYTIPKSHKSDGSLTNDNVWVGFTFSGTVPEQSNINIEILPEYEGSFVTDGVNDMIVSQNPVSEMLGGSKELTVVSMIHQITGNENYTNGYTNYIRHSGGFIRNSVAGKDGKGLNKTGIYGYTSTQLDSSNMGLGNVINNILGDKEDYAFERSSTYILDDAKYSVQNFINGEGNVSNEGSQVAWYWTFIAKRVLTTDEINQVIAYYNLDKHVKPDVYYDVKKQGLTNDNHAQFGDKLIDYSGNGRDLQLFNIGWKGESGIGRYTEEFKNDYWIVHRDQTGIIKDGNSIKVVGKLSNYYIVYHIRRIATNSFKVRIKGIKTEILYRYISSGEEQSVYFKKDGIYDIPASETVDSTSSLGFYFRYYDDINLDWIGLTIEIIPSNKGALCFDGVDDYGQFVGDLGLKDYTVAVDRAYVQLLAYQVPLISEIKSNGITPFIFEYVDSNKVNPFSFGDSSKTNDIVLNRKVSYQSTYVYNGLNITKGTATDTGKGITIGRYGDDRQYANIVLWSFLLFPYTLSEFLLERQIKKHKLGTLYPGMVEFRPIVKSNIPYSSISYSANPGEYVIEGSTVTITITLSNSSDKLVDISSNAISDISISGDNGVYEVTGMVTKSPQKINIVISSYLTMLDNETLITNETLIKNE